MKNEIATVITIGSILLFVILIGAPNIVITMVP